MAFINTTPYTPTDGRPTSTLTQPYDQETQDLEDEILLLQGVELIALPGRLFSMRKGEGDFPPDATDKKNLMPAPTNISF